MRPFSNALEREFHQAMLGTYETATRLTPPYRPSNFLQMVVDRGGKDAADALLDATNVSDGFAELFLRGRLDLSVEYLVLQDPWNQLFLPDQLAKARGRLREHGLPQAADSRVPEGPAEQSAEPDAATDPIVTPRVHICIGDQKLDHLSAFEAAPVARDVDFDWWNTKAAASPGDSVVFYMKKPISAFVAFGTVNRPVADGEVPLEGRSKWYGANCFWIREVKMLARHVTLDEAKSRFPTWSYLRRPDVASFPNESTPLGMVEEFLDFLRMPPLPTPEASDREEPPSRIRTTSYRVLRDTEMAREIKRLHAHKCQICGHTIELPNGLCYAEAHHIQPLGSGHNGPDISGNILCVCPNHHAELDYGVAAISLTDLRHVKGHAVDQRHVDYHNIHIHRARPN